MIRYNRRKRDSLFRCFVIYYHNENRNVTNIHTIFIQRKRDDGI